MMDKRTLLLYLLSRMRSKERVREALADLGASEEDVNEAYEAADRLGFEATHAAAHYIDALGPPTSSALDTSVDPSSPFAGSRLLRFSLPTWPELDFAVRAHPTGYAWGRCFLRSLAGATPPLTTVRDLAPWRFVDAEVTKAFGPSKSEDAWAGWEDLSYSIPESPGGPTRRYLLRFDMGLLQAVDPLE
ncbi:hypothetical protein [Sorangium sp. So ce131]|uniref:hypothetical protein n=1 Tax=Sorangium sp. So ce131 TaxID=3133282 RepID=UPI003F641FF9